MDTRKIDEAIAAEPIETPEQKKAREEMDQQLLALLTTMAEKHGNTEAEEVAIHQAHHCSEIFEARQLAMSAIAALEVLTTVLLRKGIVTMADIQSYHDSVNPAQGSELVN